MSGQTILSLQGLTKQFGGLTAVNNVSFSIEPQQIFGLIGPNGAGKTTIFNLITGILPPTGGSVLFCGENITSKPPHVIAKDGIARTFQNIKLFSNLSVIDNLITSSQVHMEYTLLDGLIRTPKCRKIERETLKRALELLEQLNIMGYKDATAGNLPYGIQRRVEIARALSLQPKLLLLDEPAAGMNEDETAKMVALIRDIRDRWQLAVLVIDHHMDMMMDMCSHIAVLNFGQMIASGSPEEIQNNPTAIEAYLGVDET